MPRGNPTPPPDRRPVPDTGQGFFRRGINRALGRKPAPPRVPDVSEIPPAEDKSWQPGDQAECTFEGPWQARLSDGSVEVGVPGPSIGERLIVSDVNLGRASSASRQPIVLKFKGRYNQWFTAECFRKLRPVADKAEAADSAFLADLRHRLSRQPERA